MGDVVEFWRHGSGRRPEEVGGNRDALAAGDLCDDRAEFEGDAVDCPFAHGFGVRLDAATRKLRNHGLASAKTVDKLLVFRHAAIVGNYFRLVNGENSVLALRESEHDWSVMLDETESQYRAAVGLRFKETRVALGYNNRSALARLFVEDERDVKALADRIRQWEDGKALVQPFFVRQLKLRHGVDPNWIYEGDMSGLPSALADALWHQTRAVS